MYPEIVQAILVPMSFMCQFLKMCMIQKGSVGGGGGLIIPILAK